MLYCKAKGTLIVPKWTSASFWRMIFDRNMHYHNGISDVIEFSEPGKVYRRGSSNQCIFGTERFQGQVLAVKFM